MALLNENPSLTVKQLIPSGKQLSRNINQRYDHIFETEIRPMVNTANKNGFSLTTDFAQKKNYSYLGLTLHFIDDDWLALESDLV